MNVNFFVDFSSPLVVSLAIVAGVVLYGLVGAVVGGLTYRLTHEDDITAGIVGVLWPISLPICVAIILLLIVVSPFVHLAAWIGGVDR